MHGTEYEEDVLVQVDQKYKRYEECFPEVGSE